MQDFDLIETPENVELEQRLAGIGSRFLAGLVDNLLLVGLFAILFIILLLSGANPIRLRGGLSLVHNWALAMFIVVMFLLYWGYFVFFEMVTNGQSPGKKRLNIRVVKQGGGAITFTDIAIRSLLRAVDGLLLYVVAGLSMFVTKRCQRLGDLAAGTVVVSEQTADYSARADKPTRTEWEHTPTPDQLRATGLEPEEYRVLANYWARRHELTVEARCRLLPRLLRPILDREGVSLPDEAIETLEGFVGALMRHSTDAGRSGTGRPPGGTV